MTRWGRIVLLVVVFGAVGILAGAEWGIWPLLTGILFAAVAGVAAGVREQ